jgi:TonB family protein
MRSISAGLFTAVQVTVGIVTLTSSPLASAASTAEMTNAGLSRGIALAQFLYSPPMAPSMRTCVDNVGAVYAEKINARTLDVETLQTKSRQQEALAKIAELKDFAPIGSRAFCMTMAHLYLDYAENDNATSRSGLDTLGTWATADTLSRIASDLTPAALQNIRFLLVNSHSDAVAACGPWLTGTEFRKYVTDERACEEGLRQPRALVITNAMRLQGKDLWEERNEVYTVSVGLCFRGDKVSSGEPGLSEDHWKQSCQLAKLTELSTANVRPPEVPRAQVVAASTAVVPPSAQAVADGVTRTPLRPDPRVSPPSIQEYYPPTSMRLGEEGVVKVKFCVGPNGRVVSAELGESSGFERLDEAAVKVTKLYRFTPATEDGKPVEACAAMTLKFSHGK